jgi:hypothetical protein
MKNAIATLTLRLNIPEHRVASVAKANGLDPANDADYEPILNALQSEIEDAPSDWLEYVTGEDVEVDG